MFGNIPRRWTRDRYGERSGFGGFEAPPLEDKCPSETGPLTHCFYSSDWSKYMERATSREQNRILLQINHIDERGIGGKD